MDIRENLSVIYENMEKSAARSGRGREDITLVCVTKTVSPQRIREAVALGERELGENRVQELLSKYDSIDGANWHLIGQLQRNKIKYILDKVKLVHSLCSLSVAEEMQRLCLKRDTHLDCLIEVNIAKEETKSGLEEEEILDFIDRIAPLDRVRVRGLMTVAPFVEDPEEVRSCFAAMRHWFERLSGRSSPSFQMEYLSMGMSGDYTVAIEEGANMIRLGSSIFGHRNYH